MRVKLIIPFGLDINAPREIHADADVISGEPFHTSGYGARFRRLTPVPIAVFLRPRPRFARLSVGARWERLSKSPFVVFALFVVHYSCCRVAHRIPACAGMTDPVRRSKHTGIVNHPRQTP